MLSFRGKDRAIETGRTFTLIQVLLNDWPWDFAADWHVDWERPTTLKLAVLGPRELSLLRQVYGCPER